MCTFYIYSIYIYITLFILFVYSIFSESFYQSGLDQCKPALVATGLNLS